MHAPHHLVASVTATAAALLQGLQGTRAWPDTIITKQVVTESGIFEKIGTIARLVMSMSVMLLAIALVAIAWTFRRASQHVTAFLDHAYSDLSPLVRNVNVVSEDVRDMVSSIKGDVRQVQQTVDTANAQLLKTIRQTGERIDDFNGFIKVVQEEVEATFVSAAAAVRGVRTGLEQALDHNAGENDDDDDERAPYAGPARPRVRTRGGTGEAS